MKLLKAAIVWFVLFIVNTGMAQSFSWMNGAGGTFDDLSGKVVRGSKNFYLYGNFEDNVTITNTKSGAPIQLTSHGFGSDIFLISVDSLGEALWAKSFGSVGYDTIMGSIRFNQADSTLLMIGTHTSDFYYGSGPSDFVGLYNGAGQSVAFLKIKENGDVVKVKTTTEFGIGFQYMNDVQQNDTSYILSGLFGGSLVFPKKNGSGDTTITGDPLGSPMQPCVISLDTSFKFNFLTLTPQYIYKMELDSIGNIYGIGGYDRNINSNWYVNTSLIKLSPSGDLKFAKLLKTNSISYARYSYLNIISDNKISFTTHSSDTTYFDNVNLYTSPLCTWSTHQPFEFFSLRLDSTGNITNIIPYEIGTTMVYGIDFNMNKLKESYFTIPYTGTFSANGTTYTSNGGSDVLLYAFDANANINWVQSFGSSGDDYCNSITFDDLNNPVLHGTFESSITVNQRTQKSGTPINISSNGGKDVFYAKINRTENIATSIPDKLSPVANVSLFPNPAKDKLYVKVPDAKKDHTLELFDAYGKLLLRTKIETELSEINISGYKAGIYFYNISGSNTKTSGKVVIE